jgi:hypothetical protein
VSLNLYELANGGHTVVYTKDRNKDLDSLPYIPMYGELREGFRAVSRPTCMLGILTESRTTIIHSRSEAMSVPAAKMLPGIGYVS